MGQPVTPNAFFNLKPAVGLLEIRVPWHTAPIYTNIHLADAVRRLLREGHEDTAKKILDWPTP
jgi:hypothetical protein